MTNDQNEKARGSKRTPSEKRGRNNDEAGAPKAKSSSDGMSQKSKRDLDPDDSPFVDDADMDTPTSPRSR